MGVLPRIGAEVSLTQRAYEVLREAILSNAFRPGQILSEETLAAELAISRTPVRAALKQLEFEHMVVLNPSKNIVVSDISRSDLRDVTTARQALEPVAVKLLATHIGTDQLCQLRDQIGLQRQALADEDIAALIRLDYAFHMHIARFAGNRWIAEMVDTVNLASRRYMGLSEHAARHWEATVREHTEIVDLIEQKKSNMAAERMRHHIGQLTAWLLH